MNGSHTLGPKTDAGVRALAVPPNVVPVLVEHLTRFVGPEPDDFLFSIKPKSPDKVWSKARRAAGRPDLPFHELRHAGLTWAAATGASVADLMRRGGHANATVALRYQHATEDRALADALAPVAPLLPIETDGARRGHDSGRQLALHNHT